MYLAGAFVSGQSRAVVDSGADGRCVERDGIDDARRRVSNDE